MRASFGASAFALSIVVLLLSPGPAAQAGEWVLTNLVDTTDLMPDGVTLFASFGGAVIEGDTVVFHGNDSVSGGYDGIFRYEGGAVHVVADTTMLVPGQTDTFYSFGIPSISGGNVAFTGTYGPTPDSRKEGIYKSVGGTLSMVADADTPIPGGTGTFTHYQGAVSLDGEDLGFRGMKLDQDGVYTSIGGSLSMVADKHTSVPGGTGNFNWFWHPSFDEGSVAFQADQRVGSYSTFNGVYTNLGGTLHAVADENTLMPGETVKFVGFGWDVSLDGDRVAFTGGGGTASVSRQGVFIYDNSAGSLVAIVDQDTLIPGGTGDFRSFSTPTLDGENLVFFGWGDDLGESVSQNGIYAFIDGQLTEVVSTSTLLDDFAGYNRMDIHFTSEGFSGDSLVFSVTFLAESPMPYYELRSVGSALYRADFVTQSIPEPASMLLIGAGLVGLARLRRRIVG